MIRPLAGEPPYAVGVALKRQKKKRMDKADVVYTYNGILLSHKKNKIILFEAIWMNLKIIILSEVSQR